MNHHPADRCIRHRNLGRFSPALLRVVAALAVALGVTCLTSVAAAQSNTFYLDRAQIAGAPDDGFLVERPKLWEKTRFYGSATLGYSLNPLRAGTVSNGDPETATVPDLVQNQVITYLGVGAEFFNVFGVNLMLPVAIVTDAYVGDGGTGIGGGTGGAAVHDMRLGTRVKLYESDDRLVRLGLGGSFFFPTGSPDAYAGDDAVTAYLFGMGEMDFEKFILTANVGPHFRPSRGIQGANSSFRLAHELRMAFGAYLSLREDVWRIGGEVFGSTGLASDEDSIANGNMTDGRVNTIFNNSNTPFEWMASIRYQAEDWIRPWVRAGGGTRFTDGYGAPDLRLLVQMGYWMSLSDLTPDSKAPGYYQVPEAVPDDLDTDGDGFPDSIDACPTIKEDGKPPNPGDGCPADADRDGDGIIDIEDKCPDVPEDKDGVQDADGCPEDDADDDGIPDQKDACPLVPGFESEDPKQNGCPRKKHKRIVEEDGEIVLLEPIQFETARADIKAVSFPILDEVVGVMNDRPDVRIAVHGHTDSRGGHDYNVNLSQRRAASVVKYLTGKGINPKRLESEGFGPDKPIDSNDTEEGRAKNRRVEFKIIE